MAKVLPFICILIFASKSFATGTINTGEDLLGNCALVRLSAGADMNDIYGANACINFLVGFDSGHSIAPLTLGSPKLYCPPKGSNIKSMAEAVLNLLDDEKQLIKAPAGIVAWKAFSKKWPCE